MLGPFYVAGSPDRDYGASIAVGDQPGDPVVVQGRVIDLTGAPVPGAVLDIWQTAANGLYAVQDREQDPENLRGRFAAGIDGGYQFRTVQPVPYQVPHDGPVGRLLEATGRHPWRPGHIHIMASAPGYETLITHIFDADSDYLESDAVFAVRHSLIVKFVEANGELSGHFDIALPRHDSPG